MYKKGKTKKKRRKKKETRKNTKDAAELSVESSEPSSIPWIPLKAIIRCITKAIGSSCENFIYNEGALPFWFEHILLLLWEAQNKFAAVISLAPHLSALVSPSLLLIKRRTGSCNITLLFKAVEVVLPIELGLSLFVHAHSR